MANLEIKQCFLTNNDCYKSNKKITPAGIVVHSTGANNPKLSRYVQPDDGILGKNQYNNDWNRSGTSACVNAFIGKDKNGVVRVYQTLPWDMRPWGCGKGSKGSYNNSYIQFEICEDSLTDEKYFNEAFELAIKLCAHLCKEYNISVENVISHKEAHQRGYGSNHGDCDHWLKKFGKDMDWFRDEVDHVLHPAVAAPVVNLTVGQKVKLKDGATYTSGKGIPKWVFNSTLYVRQISGDNVKISILKVGAITGTVKAYNLESLSAATSTPSTSPSVTTDYTQEQFIKDVCKILKVNSAVAAFNKTVTISTFLNKNHALVTPLERYMKALGYYKGDIEADLGKKPNFGKGMKAAIKEYQKNVVKAKPKNQDGVVSKKGASWKKLLGLS